MSKTDKTIPDHQIAQTAKRIVVTCFCNTVLEDYHAGWSPSTKTGDYSDVTVIDADGQELRWTECSHISQAEMKALMIEAVDNVYTVLKCMDDPGFQGFLAAYEGSIRHWDKPKLNEAMLEWVAKNNLDKS